jgi:hypothetical protein
MRMMSTREAGHKKLDILETLWTSWPLELPSPLEFLAPHGIFDEAGPDAFVLVTIVNRFDLTPHPRDAVRPVPHHLRQALRPHRPEGPGVPHLRALAIFEPSLANPVVCLEACRPIAEDWAALQGAGAAEIGDFVEALFFEGVHGFAPVIHPSSFGPEREDTQGYGGGFEDGDEGGQIRVSMHMEDPWAMHELRFHEEPAHRPVRLRAFHRQEQPHRGHVRQLPARRPGQRPVQGAPGAPDAGRRRHGLTSSRREPLLAA